MFTYCTRVLHFAEHAAFNRIEAARAARRFPIILTLLADGRVHLSAVRLLAPHLTEANHDALLKEASHKSKREIEEIVARLVPRPDGRSSVRKVLSIPVPTTPVPAVTSESTPMELVAEPAAVPASVQRPRTEPLAPGRYKLQFTVGEETYRKLRRAQDLLRHSVRSGDPAEVFDRASHCCSLISRKRNSQPPRDRVLHKIPARDRDMSRPTFAARSGHAMVAGVDLRDQRDGAVKQGCSSFITSFRLLEEVRQPLTISSYVAPPTIVTKRSNVSVCLFERVRRSIRLSPDLRPSSIQT